MTRLKALRTKLAVFWVECVTVLPAVFVRARCLHRRGIFALLCCGHVSQQCLCWYNSGRSHPSPFSGSCLAANASRYITATVLLYSTACEQSVSHRTEHCPVFLYIDGVFSLVSQNVFFLLGDLFLIMPVLTVMQSAWASVLMLLSFCCLWVWNLVSFPERRANLGPLFAHSTLHVVESGLYRIVYVALIPECKNSRATKLGMGGPNICGSSVGVELTSCHPSWRIEFWSGS